jgi:hypothetical protein
MNEWQKQKKFAERDEVRTILFIQLNKYKSYGMIEEENITAARYIQEWARRFGAGHTPRFFDLI